MNQPSDLEDPPVARLVDLERLFQRDVAMSPAARDLAHQAAMRLFDLDPAEVGLREPGSQLGPYRIVRILGCGGQALVYEAEDTDLGRPVALKVPRPDVGDRLLKEARAVGALNHPHVVRVEALREHDGQPYLVMELCNDGNLYDLLEGHPEGLPLDLVKSIGDQVLAALGHAHTQGVVHRDVKPGNVLFNDGLAKLGDFGIGKRVDEGAFEHSVFADQASQMTQGAVGTPLYMAPEQRDRGLLRGQPLDGRTDLYSFGRMLRYMVTGRTPDDYQPASRVRAGLDPGWDELIWSLTDRDRDQRPADAQEVRLRLANLPGDPPPPLPRVAVVAARTRAGSSGSVARAELLAPHKPEWEKPEHLRKHSRRRRVRILLGGLGVFVLLVFAALLSSPTSVESSSPTIVMDASTQSLPVAKRVAHLDDAWATSTVRRARGLITRRPMMAGELLERVVERHPGYAEAWALLAEAHAREGRLKAAGQAATRARRLDPRAFGSAWYKRTLQPLIDALAQPVPPTPASGEVAPADTLLPSRVPGSRPQ